MAQNNLPPSSALYSIAQRKAITAIAASESIVPLSILPAPQETFTQAFEINVASFMVNIRDLATTLFQNKEVVSST